MTELPAAACSRGPLRPRPPPLFHWPRASQRARRLRPPARRRLAGNRYKVGSFEITVATDGVNRFKLPDNIVANAKREDVNAALAAAYLQPDIFVTPYNPIVVNTGQKLVVIDTGLGEAGFNASKGANGQFLTNLAAAGIDAKAIDTVIISHYNARTHLSMTLQ
jgi:hypothetical protein